MLNTGDYEQAHVERVQETRIYLADRIPGLSEIVIRKFLQIYHLPQIPSSYNNMVNKVLITVFLASSGAFKKLSLSSVNSRFSLTKTTQSYASLFGSSVRVISKIRPSKPL